MWNGSRRRSPTCSEHILARDAGPATQDPRLDTMPSFTEKDRDTCIMVYLLRMSLVDGLEEDEIEYLKGLAAVFQIGRETADGMIDGAES